VVNPEVRRAARSGKRSVGNSSAVGGDHGLEQALSGLRFTVDTAIAEHEPGGLVVRISPGPIDIVLLMTVGF
jgi:hypothetical protein